MSERVKHPRTASAPPSLLADLFGLDLRSLALARVALAVVVLLDLAVRATDLTAFFTDAGVSPRAEVLESFAWLHAWPICVHLAGGGLWTQAMLFSITAAAAVALLMGYRTRLATIVVWLLITSMQLRNLYIGHGSDAQLRMMLLWGCFLPLGARWSMDSALTSSSEPPARNQYLSVATVAVVGQLVIIYLSTAYAKSLQPAWNDGTALALSLDDEFWVTAPGLILQRWPALCRVLTYSVLYLELAAPLLLFVPIALGPLRTATVMALIAMHIGFAVGLRVGIFPWVSVACVLILLPRWFWDQVVPRLRAPVSGWGEPIRARLAARTAAGDGALAAAAARSPTVRPSWIREVVCAVFFAYVIFWNVGVAQDATYQAPPALAWFGSTFFLQQDWRMFARPAATTGWMVVAGKLEDGTEIDLFSEGGPLPSRETPVSWEKPDRLSGRGRNYRWIGFIDKMVHNKRGEQQILYYGRYLCRQWNATHDGAKQLTTLEIYFMSRPVKPSYAEYQLKDYDKVLLWTHWCFK